MKTIKRIWENIKWLFNHPPTCWTMTTEEVICNYCKQEPVIGSWTINGNTICYVCLNKVYDSVLGDPK